MAGKSSRGNPVAVSDLATSILDPLMRKRAGMSVDLVQSWEEIVGDRLAASTRPERIAWPRRLHEDDPFEPATLVVACEGAAALRLQHESAEVVSRVNSFLGFAAIGRLRIVQKPVSRPQTRRPPRRPLTAEETDRLSTLTTEIEDDGLREALRKLGGSVMRMRSK